MNPLETKRLLAYQYASRHAPRTSKQGMSFAKGRAAGYGSILKSSRIHSMSVETQHSQRTNNHY